MTDLLPAGPKLRLLARFARLESRSPVTSLLPAVGTPAVSPGTGVVRGEIPGTGNVVQRMSPQSTLMGLTGLSLTKHVGKVIF